MNYLNAVTILRERFPEFTESGEKWDDALPHDAYGTFALFLCRLIERGASERLIARAFDLFNEMAEGEDDIVNLLEVSVLEIVADHPACLRIAENRLSGAARQLLKRVQRGGFADA
jgi:hypothetical protein